MPLSHTLALPPVASKKPTTRTFHGRSLADDYAWLRAKNWREVLKNPVKLPVAIRKHLEAENAYSSALLAPLSGLQETLVAEMRGRIREDVEEPPVRDGPYLYFDRYRTGGDHAIVCRRQGETGTEEVLLDGDALATGKGFFKLSDCAHSPDHRLLAWSADLQGSEYHTIQVRDLASGSDFDTIIDTTGSAVWLKDSSGFLYVALDAEHRDNRVFLHRLGTPQSVDIMLHEEKIPGFFVSISETQDRAFGLIDIHDHETSEVRIVDPANPAATSQVIHPREIGLQYDLEHHDGQFVIRTNADGAKDFKLVVAPVATPGKAHWRDFVPHEPGTLIARIANLKRHLVRLERAGGLPRVVIREWATGAEHTIAFAEEAYSLSFSTGYEYDTNALRFVYSSLTTPPETWDYDMASRARTLIKRREIPSGHTPADYITRRIEAIASDGERIPVSLLYARNTPLDGSAPCLLYSYGAYGIVMHASFRANILSLVNRGFVFAIAHVRGGMDKGFGWYESGKREHKPNTFTDFITAAETLITARYTASGRIIAHGGSAGGMLMGAIANMRPELFAGIIADVPFVDVLTTMLDKDLPLTPPEWPEWGNPIDSAEAFRTIASYSPYDNVKAQAYPPILIEAGLTDPRVTYWEPAKWAAKLRATMTGGGPILLNTNMEAGHGGASGRLKQLQDDARAYAFALSVVGKG